MRKMRYFAVWFICVLLSTPFSPIVLGDQRVSGRVFDDVNKNQKLDQGEKGVPGVSVSNQREVVVTDSQGRYSLNAKPGSIIFITKPSGYSLPVNKYQLPQFYHIYQSQDNVKPNQTLTIIHNFPLVKTNESNEFEVIVFADPQVRNDQEINFLQGEAIVELMATKAAFGITLGDITYDMPSLYDHYNNVVAQMGIPVFNVPGNHDVDQDTLLDEKSLETFKDVFGPPYYSFDYGQVHFVVLDSVEWLGEEIENDDAKYIGNIDDRQLAWLANDLEHVPLDKLIVFCLHIPFVTNEGDWGPYVVNNRQEVFKLLKNRNYLLALSGHLHQIEHHFMGPEHGWNNSQSFHQMLCSALSGGGWDDCDTLEGLPIVYQWDASPAGYHLFHFTGNTYTERFKPTLRDPGHQMRISQPKGTISTDDANSAQIIVNVFDGSERSIVTCQVDNSPPVKMTKETSPINDPFMAELALKFRKFRYRSRRQPHTHPHLWTAPLPMNLSPGDHTITVRTTDQFGNTYHAVQFFQVQ